MPSTPIVMIQNPSSAKKSQMLFQLQSLPVFILLLFLTNVDAMHGTSPSISLSLASQSSSSALLNPLVVKGTKFFDSVTGDEVVIKGVTYYPRPNSGDLNHNSIDYFTSNHSSTWKRDIPFLKALGVNAIRLYAVNATENHDEFMLAMNEAGIYVMVGLGSDCPTCAITRSQSPDCYPPELKRQGMDIIDAFSKYDNTLAFSAGNEVNHFVPIGKPEWNAPCQKKFIADMRRYIASCSISSSSSSNITSIKTPIDDDDNHDDSNSTNIDSDNTMRKIPVGLVLADTDRTDNAMYYNCIDEQVPKEQPDDDDDNDDEDEYGFAEFYGLNTYVDCNGTATTYDEFLGLKSLQQSFNSYNYSIPVLLTEFGCLSDTYPTVDGYEGQRTFLEAKFLMERPELRDIFAGGFVFEYSTEAENAKSQSPYPFRKFGKQNFGLGYFSPEDCDDINQPCEYNPFPSSKFLADAYQSFHTANQTTRLHEYEPPFHRTKRSVCPSSFPSIYSLTWETDTVVPSHQCPKQSSQYTRLIDQGLFSQWEMVASVIGSILVVVIVSALTFREAKTTAHRRGYEPIKNNSDNDGYESTDLSSSASSRSFDDEHYSSDRHQIIPQDLSSLQRGSFQMSV